MNIIRISLILLGIIGILLITTSLVDFEGSGSDMTMPKGAIDFAYEHMLTKHNVTFVKININPFEGYWERHYWVTDTEGTTYRLVWSKMHHEIKLNTPYTIHYLDGYFNALWEYEPENSS